MSEKRKEKNILFEETIKYFIIKIDEQKKVKKRITL
jgi:hypothetical protein